MQKEDILRAAPVSGFGQNGSAEEPGWYCVRTKPKHEHIAAASVRENLGLDVFLARLKVQRLTRVGVHRFIEPLFPCYIFVRCSIGESAGDIRRANGVKTFVHFGNAIPSVPDGVIEELRECFAISEAAAEECVIEPGTEVVLSEGAFAGMHASVLRVLPAKSRVEVMLDMLGRSMPVEVASSAVVPNGGLVTAGLSPFLVGNRVTQRENLRG